MNNRENLNKFSKYEFYTIFYQNLIKDRYKNELVGVKLHDKGAELVRQYHSNKYNATIHFPIIQTSENIRYANIFQFINEFKHHLAKAKNKFGIEKNDCRIAFYIGTGVMHATPFIYIKENGDEGVLYADSLGASNEFAKMLSDKSNLNVYAIKDQRQADSFSCYSEALIFCRDATAKDAYTHQYYIPSLLTSLIKHAISKDGFFITTLPPELLKTAQLSKFISRHVNDDNNTPIHKSETLDDFRRRYTDYSCKVKGAEGTKNMPSYLRIKGITHADKIEIQFYLNQLEGILGETLPIGLTFDFIKEAKAELKSQGSVHPSRDRKGLHEFTENYLSLLKSEGIDSPDRHKSLSTNRCITL